MKIKTGELNLNKINRTAVKDDRFKEYCLKCGKHTLHNTGGCIRCRFSKEVENE